VGRRAVSDRGQASLELLAGLPLLLLAALGCLQLLATGYSQTLADGAAEAGAIAIASGESAEPAVERALPGWASKRVAVGEEGGRVTVRLRPPALFDGLGKALEVSSTAWARRPQGSS